MPNYGFFCYDSGATPELARRAQQISTPTQKVLMPVTNPDFRGADGWYAASDAWVTQNLTPQRRQRTTFGAHKDPARIVAWQREFNATSRTAIFRGSPWSSSRAIIPSPPAQTHHRR